MIFVNIRRSVVQHERSVSVHFRMKYILLFSIIVFTLQSTTAKKIKCFPVTEETTTVTKTTTQCPRVACRNLYIWSEKLCKCICPQIHCPDGYELGDDCNCIPVTTTTEPTTTTTECPFRATCPNYYEWREDVCDCVCPPLYYCPKGSTPGGDCDCLPDTTPGTTECPEQECRNRYVWLQDMCECVCPPMYCPEGTIHGGDCDCIPDTTIDTTDSTPELCEPIVGCNRSWFWNYETCACQLGCDFIRIDCPQGTKWDIFACNCTDACPGVVCEENMVADSETCICVPIDVTDTSPETTLPDCSEVFCAYGYDLDNSTCACIPTDSTGSTPIYCPEWCMISYDWNGVPSCQCTWGCDYIMQCPKDQKWDFDVCGCVDDPDYTSTSPETSLSDCGEIYCIDGFYVDPFTCSCVPVDPFTSTTIYCPEQCYIGYYSTGDQYCQCAGACDYGMECPEGQKWDFGVCACIDDPDYNSTTPDTTLPECGKIACENGFLDPYTCECIPYETTDDETTTPEEETSTTEWEEDTSPFTDFPTNATECGPCDCPNKKSVGSFLPCSCPKGQKPTKAEEKGHYCCIAPKTDKWTWPKKCKGETVTEKNYKSFSCGDKVEKHCGQCVKGDFQSYTDPKTKVMGCCCNETPE